MDEKDKNKAEKKKTEDIYKSYNDLIYLSENAEHDQEK